MFTRRSLLYGRNAFTKLCTIRQKNTVTMFINGKEVTVPSYYTIIQAIRKQGVVIPSFCYHDRLSIAGNCRMCLVQIEGWPKAQIACAVPVANKMRVRTNSEVTYRAQEGVIEFILADHPLDCPICDQGGECDLQDIAMNFGNDRSRFTDIHFRGKRAVESKNLGPLIGTAMNRCIHCTRCIRFASQVCGLDVLGSTGRGSDMLVGTYVDKYFLSEVSGNIVDLCPVGALTSRQYHCKARPWEISKTNSIDVTDATGTNISINYRFDKVLRVLPREHGELNQEWLSDKGRWAIDSLEMQRLVTPMTKQKGGAFQEIEWGLALQLACCAIKKVAPDSVVAIAGPHTNVETLVAAKDFLNTLGSEHTYTERGLNHSISKADIRASYSLDMNMSDIAKADKILLVGTNPRFEAPILNTWIRLAYRENECDISYIGPKTEFNYNVTCLGDDMASLKSIGDFLNNAKNPMIFVGISLLQQPYAGTLMKKLNSQKKCGDGRSIVHVIPREASMCGALEAGWKPGGIEVFKKLPANSVVISLGADEIFYDWNANNGYVIYVGFQGDKGADVAQLVLPGCAYTEAGGVYLNMECRSQQAWPAVTPPGKARLDWKIFRALAEISGIQLKFSDARGLSCRMSQISPNFIQFGKYQQKLFKEQAAALPTAKSAEPTKGGDGGKFDIDIKFLEEYYCSCVFSCNSPTMVKAQKAACDLKKSLYAQV